MISKSQQNMAILDEEIKFTQNMNEMPKNLSLDKINCDKPTSLAPKTEPNTNPLNDLSENSKNIGDNNEIKTNEFQSETRIQLSFSVDRLLSNKLQQIIKSPPPPPPPTSQTDTHSHDRHSDKCCDELNSSYACCSLPNCLVNSPTTASTSLSLQANSYPSIDEEMTTGSNANFMDYKSVVRPTPMRPMSNSSESVPSLTHFSSLPPTSLIRFHHAHMQQQKQLSQHLPAQPNFTLSSLMNPLCGLKPLQMNVQQMGLQNFSTTTANRFNTKMNFDIPVVRSCISSLRHHHMGTTTNSNESHMNFNTNTTASATGNTATTNTNTPNAHTNISSGKRKRSWSRAVFSNLQRKGLEIQFQQQKYITKPDRRKLAARLNLTDAQVKVWFQNRRMKWRHTRENLKSGQEKQPGESVTADTLKANVDNVIGNDLPGYSSDGSSSLEMSDVEDDDDEIDVVE
ncbi:homeobox protein H2.0 [Lucilia cuprina]|uniref:homeobox protein H2.0 n=1 Tax=Lucilia cuprina TaxID=7375 RepID=UPI001F052FC4|nr:homeobox protein H2.0 [Lucilia cuprina]